MDMLKKCADVYNKYIGFNYTFIVEHSDYYIKDQISYDILDIKITNYKNVHQRK